MKGTEVNLAQMAKAQKFIQDHPLNGRKMQWDEKVTLPFGDLVRLVAWYGALRFKGGRDGSGGTLEEPADIVESSRNDGLPELPGEVISKALALLKQANLLGTRKPGEIIPDGLSLQVYDGEKGQKVFVRLYDGRPEGGLKARLILDVETKEWELDLFMDNNRAEAEGIIDGDRRPLIVDKPAGSRWCSSCRQVRPVYEAGDGSTAAVGSICCSYCQRILTPPAPPESQDTGAKIPNR